MAGLLMDRMAGSSGRVLEVLEGAVDLERLSQCLGTLSTDVVAVETVVRRSDRGIRVLRAVDRCQMRQVSQMRQVHRKSACMMDPVGF